jgi:hypothetical protein
MQIDARAFLKENGLENHQGGWDSLLGRDRDRLRDTFPDWQGNRYREKPWFGMAENNWLSRYLLKRSLKNKKRGKSRQESNRNLLSRKERVWLITDTGTAVRKGQEFNTDPLFGDRAEGEHANPVDVAAAALTIGEGELGSRDRMAIGYLTEDNEGGES